MQVEGKVVKALASLSEEAPISVRTRGACMHPLVEDGADIVDIGVGN